MLFQIAFNPIKNKMFRIRELGEIRNCHNTYGWKFDFSYSYGTTPITLTFLVDIMNWAIEKVFHIHQI